MSDRLKLAKWPKSVMSQSAYLPPWYGGQAHESAFSSNPPSNPHYHFSGSMWSDSNNIANKEKTSGCTIKYNLNSQLSALSASQDYNHVVVAGREAVKILSASDQKITEEDNLRVKASSRYSVSDVKWGNNATKSKIATATTNGSIVIYDLGNGRARLERKIQDHVRAVNRICFNPPSGVFLLSASHDGTMKLWDLRDSTSAKMTLVGNSEGVRDVQFNVQSQNEIAAAFENGTIQKWDIRRPTMYERKFNAHVGSVLAIDWNSDGRTLASGGRDKTIKANVKKERDVIFTMTGITRIQWRPNHPDEIASCAMLNDSRIFIWNVKRPYISSYFFEEHDDVPTGLMWRDQDVLWSVSKDKCFVQQNIKDSAIYTLDLLSKSGIGWSVYDDVSFVIDGFNDETTEDQQSLQFRKNSRKFYYNSVEFRNETHSPYQQRTGEVTLQTFDYSSFEYLAKNYTISDSDIWNACEHNCKVAWEVKRLRTAQTWKIIQILYGKKTDDNPNVNIKTEQDAPPSKSPDELKGPDLYEEPDNVAETNNIQNDDETPAIESEPEDEDFYEIEPPDNEYSSLSKNDKNEAYKVRSPVRIPWNNEPMMTQLLEYYAEQGDVQMCVTLVMVLGDRLKLNQDKVEQWFFSYIALACCYGRNKILQDYICLHAKSADALEVLGMGFCYAINVRNYQIHVLFVISQSKVYMSGVKVVLMEDILFTYGNGLKNPSNALQDANINAYLRSSCFPVRIWIPKEEIILFDQSHPLPNHSIG
ncbi:17543_t:CDS:10 [Acaulospora morrowiae]|uniref:17543_t:CDS:1 n=1 Tax=Acaulospora morrowiae TaxID=94023 RepID=A0A9N9BF60_9GLOM|nr:17543_t:CDS:10 [Acaulospora morrowiae]